MPIIFYLNDLFFLSLHFHCKDFETNSQSTTGPNKAILNEKEQSMDESGIISDGMLW